MRGIAGTTVLPKPSVVLWALPLTLLAGLAQAHVGAHEAGFAAGVGHPVGGADHVLAMVAVGFWAALTGGRALWVMPLAFVGAMLAGGALGAYGVAVPGVEPMILASVIVLGGAVALAVRMPLGLALAGIAVFGAAHGLAHGAEGPEAGLAGYAAGFLMATAALHGVGLALGLGVRRMAGAARLLGLLTAGAGVAFGVMP
jgi:urease accessory protein